MQKTRRKKSPLIVENAWGKEHVYRHGRKGFKIPLALFNMEIADA